MQVRFLCPPLDSIYIYIYLKVAHIISGMGDTSALDPSKLPPAPSEEDYEELMDFLGLDSKKVLALVFRDCEECGHLIACKLGDPAPTSCSQHQ